MVFEGKIYRTYGEIFDKAVELAKEANKQKCQAFLDSYASYVMGANFNGEINASVTEVMDIIEDNLVKYSYHYDDKITKLVKDTYFKNQNCRE